MADDKQERDERLKAEKEFRVRFLVKETGITEAQTARTCRHDRHRRQLASSGGAAFEEEIDGVRPYAN
ncbi:hypothetical protein ACVOMV_23915 [Mesorhizobium atlanticum]